MRDATAVPGRTSRRLRPEVRRLRRPRDRRTVTHQALRDGDVDVALLFSTDPALVDYVELTDDRHLQPADNVIPLVRDEVVERWGADVVAVIDAVSHELDTDSLRQLNTLDEAIPGSDDVPDIATAWLQSEGLA